MINSYPEKYFSPANFIFIIECLPESEKATGKNRREAIRDIFVEKNIYNELNDSVHCNECKSKEDFFNSIGKIKYLCSRGGQPILYIDGHGDKNNGLLLPSGEYISWEVLIESFKKITSLARGELTIFAAFCYSMSLVKKLPELEILPFAFYYGYEGEVNVEVLEMEMNIIIEKMIENDSSGEDMDNLFKSKSLQISYYSEYHVARKIIAIMESVKNHPEYLKNIGLSKSKILQSTHEYIASKGNPLKGVSRFIKDNINNNCILINFLYRIMHKTDRLRQLVQSLN